MQKYLNVWRRIAMIDSHHGSTIINDINRSRSWHWHPTFGCNVAGLNYAEGVFRGQISFSDKRHFRHGD
jgi:hypothetical protein